MADDIRIEVDAGVCGAAFRTAQLALLQRIRRIRDAVFWIDLIPPIGWFGRRDRLVLEVDSHTKASENLGKMIRRIEEIEAKAKGQADG